jgi:hypothetical protein
MTVRRVSRRRRRHLRKTRVQRGGTLDANAWASLVKDKYATVINERYNYYDDKKGIMIDNIKDLPQTNKKMYLTLTDPSDNTQLSYDLEEVAARVAAFMIDFINEEKHTSSSFINWYVNLDNDDLRNTYKGTLLTIENGLRSLASVEPIGDIGDESKFPLYIWALVFSDSSILNKANDAKPTLYSEDEVEKRVTELKAAAEAAKKTDEVARAAEKPNAQLPQLGDDSTQEGPASQEE